MKMFKKYTSPIGLVLIFQTSSIKTKIGVNIILNFPQSVIVILSTPWRTFCTGSCLEKRKQNTSQLIIIV